MRRDSFNCPNPVNRFLAIRSLDLVKWNRAPLFIAEASSNHGRDLDRARAFVDAAADAGCDAVKFQLFKIDRMFAPEILAQSPKHRARARMGIAAARIWRRWPNTVRRGASSFPARPSIWKRSTELAPFVDFYKVASYELLVTDLLKACAAHRQAGGAVHRHGDDGRDHHGRRHAESGRRARHHPAALRFRLSDAGGRSQPVRHRRRSATRPGCKTGWSDHTRRPAVIERAVHRWDASGGGIPSRSRRPGRRICRRPLLAAGGNRAGDRAHPRKPCRRRHGLQGPAAVRTCPTANGAPIPSTACARCNMCACRTVEKPREHDLRPREYPRRRRHPGAHGLHAPAGQGAQADRRPAAALAHRASPARTVASDRRHRRRHHHQSARRRHRGMGATPTASPWCAGRKTMCWRACPRRRKAGCRHHRARVVRCALHRCRLCRSSGRHADRAGRRLCAAGRRRGMRP